MSDPWKFIYDQTGFDPLDRYAREEREARDRDLEFHERSRKEIESFLRKELEKDPETRAREQAERNAQRAAENRRITAAIEERRTRRAKLEADRPRKEANRKQRVKLAWIGVSLMLSSLLIAIPFFSSEQPHSDPVAHVVLSLVTAGLMWAGIITLLFIFKYRD